ncbi:MAG: histidine phosphatase family protein [Roseivirga sp.]
MASKDLFILRHAEALLSEPHGGDMARSVTKKGLREAQKLGTYWHAQGIHFCKVMASPAVRTAKTAAAVMSQMPQAEQKVSLTELLYEGPVEAVVSMMHTWNDACQKVLAVSHRPLISLLLVYLTGKQVAQLPTCCYIHVKLDITQWQQIVPAVGTIEAIGNPRDFTVS